MASPSGPQTPEWIDAARLVRRTGFGATGPEVNAALAKGRAAYLAAALAADPDADPGAMATPAPQYERPARPSKNATATERATSHKQISADLQSLTGWWVRRMVAVTQPLAEKLTFCWHNHFATSSAKVRDARLMLQQNQTLRRMGRGSFHALAAAMLVDAAMLRWLDGQTNVVGAANENLGREFMELFALGHGDGYTETDVREGARALTGWVILPDGATKLVPKRHDNGIKTFLGVTGDLDNIGYCEAVLARPASPGYVADRTWGQLYSDTPPPAATAARFASEFRAQWDIKALLSDMLLCREFVGARNQIVVNPVEWMVGVVRAWRVPLDGPGNKTVGTLLTALNQLGQLPFYPPSVGGWASGPAWLSTAAADVRMRTALSLAKYADVEALSAAAQRERVDVAGYLLGIGAWSARSRAALAAEVGNPRRLLAMAVNTSEYLTNLSDPAARPVGAGAGRRYYHERLHPAEVPARFGHGGGRARRRRRRHLGRSFPARGGDTDAPGHADPGDRLPVRRERRHQHGDPLHRPRLPRGPPRLRLRPGRRAASGRPTRSEPVDAGIREAVAEQAVGRRPRGRVPAAGPQPLPVHGHLADRLARDPHQHGLDRPLAGCHGRRPDPRRQHRLGPAATGRRREIRCGGTDPGARHDISAGHRSSHHGARRLGPDRHAAADHRGAVVLFGTNGDEDVLAGPRPDRADGRDRRSLPRGLGRRPQRAGRPTPVGVPLHQGGGADPGVHRQPGRVRHARGREGHAGAAARPVRQRSGDLPDGPVRRPAGRRRRPDGLHGVRAAGARQRLGRHRPRHGRSGVPGGFYGEQPSLTDLDDGDLKSNVDFRSIYAELLSKTLGADPTKILGGSFAPVGALV